MEFSCSLYLAKGFWPNPLPWWERKKVRGIRLNSFIRFNFRQFRQFKFQSFILGKPAHGLKIIAETPRAQRSIFFRIPERGILKNGCLMK